MLWRERLLQFTEKTATPVRQLPITGCAHKAGVVCDAFVRAVLAALDVSAERGGATGLDRRHDLQLAEADMTGVDDAPRRAMGAKDVGDLQRGPRHAALSQAGGDGGVGLRPSLSRGLVTTRIVLTATRV
jgi:hypothetical protein